MTSLALELVLVLVLGPREPTAVPLSDVVDFAVGGANACAALGNGELWCWGDGARHVLGHGREEASRVPLRVDGVREARAVAVAEDRVCALELDGEVWCWGGGGPAPASGDADDWVEVTAPRRIATGIEGTRDIGGGRSLAALLDSAGTPSMYQSYNGPILMPGFAPAVEVVGTRQGLCTRTHDGRVQCLTTAEEALGDGGRGDGDETEPAEVVAPLVWTPALEAELTHPRDEPGERWPRLAPCNDDDDVTDPAWCRTRLRGARDLDAEGQLVCVVTEDQRVACWGCAGCYGKVPPPIGIPPRGYASMPVLVPDVHAVEQVAVGGDFVCALAPDGVRCWGNNYEGELGRAWARPTALPQRIAGLGAVVAIDAGESSVCALRADRTLTCWGRPLGARPRARPDAADPDAEASQPQLVTRAPPPADAEPGPDVCVDFDVLRRGEPLTTTRYRYDRRGHNTRIVETRHDEDGDYVSEWTFTYDRAGRVVSEKGKDTVDDTRYRLRYDREGRLIARTGSGPYDSETWTYSTDGHVLVATAHDERWWRSRVDAQGREVERRERDRGSASDTTTTYDAAGNVVRELERVYQVPFYDEPTAIYERVFTYAGARIVQTDERIADGARWLPWRTTVHRYTGCL